MVRKGIFSRWGANGAENHRKWLATGLEWPKPVGRPRRERKMAREWLWQAHLREFAFICGPFWAIGGIQMAEKSGFYRKWTQMGGQEQPGREILAGKLEIFMKTGGERALIQFSCVSCFSAWVVGSDGCRDTAG
jgi:hypothetical protein